MLIRYKKSHGKIAMGLLSYMPTERNLKTLQQTLRLYEENPDWQLFLWKDGDDYTGLIGAKVDDNHFTVHHISVLPSHRGEGIGHAMTEQLQRYMQHRKMRATKETKSFMARCRERMGA